MDSGLPPCSECGAARVPNIEIRFEADENLMPLIVQRVNGGMCIDCARRAVQLLQVQGKLRNPIVLP